MRTEYDVIIVGGGLVGLLLAKALLTEGFTVALVEVGELKIKSLLFDQYQLRVSAVNPACQYIFHNLGLWENILASNRVSTFEQMHVWDNLGRGEINFDCTELGQPALGYIIENDVLHNVLLMSLTEDPDFQLFDNTAPQNIEAAGPQAIKLNCGKMTLKTKLLVGADGANSWVRTQAHIAIHSWPYHHEALVTTVKTEKSHGKTAWQCFLPDGPLALLPLVDEQVCSIVWSGIPEEIRRLQKLDEQQFNLEISNAFEFRLGNITKIGSQATVPLFMRHAKEYVKSRIALVGDAAHTIHPLAGQGVNLGFLDAAALVQVIAHARNSNQDWGSYSLLRDYERQRKGENWLMIAAMDVFKRLFQNDSVLAVQTRSLGLNIVDHLGFLKNQFIYYAMGLKGDVPPLARASLN